MASVTVKADKRMARMAEAAKAAGCPRDQVERFITSGYVPLEGMLPFHAAAREADKVGGPEWIALGGKRGPGKSHTTMAQVGLDDCQRVPGLKGLFLRKIQKAARESLEDVIRRVFMYTEHSITADGVKFSNGSRILIGGFKDEKDIEKYLGIEYDFIVIEECTQISETKKDKLRGSLRTSKQNWRPRIYMSTNADGIGLLWFKKMFIEPYRAGKQTITRFFDVTGIHNPFINPEYEAWLDGLKGALGKAWREGDWDAFAGMAFPSWNRERHVIKPIEIPESWTRWRAVDWGYAAPFSCHFYTRNPDTKRVYVYREAYQAELTTKQQARKILDLTLPNEKITFTFADPALWERKDREGEVFTSADEYRKEGVPLTKADNDRLGGKRKVDEALADLPDGEPGLLIFENCTHMIEQLETLPLKEGTEDVDTRAEDHAYDELRYALTNERSTSKEPPKPTVHIRI